MEQTELLTRQQVADMLGVHVDTVRRLQARGAMPIVRIGGQVRVLRTDLDAYIEGNRELCGQAVPVRSLREGAA